MKLTFEEAAVLLWLPDGEKPAAHHFKAGTDLSPPSPNPEGHWTLGSALFSYKESDPEHGKRPWIKVAGVVLAPIQVLQAYEAFKTTGEFEF